MRITIDTEMRCIIVPNSYFAQIDKLNEIISAAGGTKLDYTNYIRDCFENAIANQIFRQGEVAAMRPRRSRRSAEKLAAAEEE